MEMISRGHSAVRELKDLRDNEALRRSGGTNGARLSADVMKPILTHCVKEK